MNEENQTPTPQWVTELKGWGIDVEVFDARWEQAGDDAKAEFRQALAKAAEAYEADKAEMQAAADAVREDVKDFMQKMNSAWDEMVSSMHQQFKSNAPSGDDTNDQA